MIIGWKNKSLEYRINFLGTTAYEPGKFPLATQSAGRSCLSSYALRIRPDFALTHLNYALMLRNIGRKQEAAEHRRKAASSPDANIRSAVRQALSELR
jgi:hypothetical protein